MFGFGAGTSTRACQYLILGNQKSRLGIHKLQSGSLYVFYERKRIIINGGAQV